MRNPARLLAIGFDEPIDADGMRRAALDGSIEKLLTWHQVTAGDFFYIPANTVHAIGAGIGLVEIQQNSDITFRLYDYGRPRELHLDRGIAIADGGVYDMASHRRIPDTGGARLVDGPHFMLDLIEGQPPTEVLARYRDGALVLPLTGECHYDGETIAAGECVLCEDPARIAFQDGNRVLITRHGL